ncbi:uncharacterized protein RCO7_02370 [Rhynchosporium graminicola]|uniref:Uncharacterized protein n=2 Tax=Rhynchosporium TaxID=38037 RepID=A0A1E1M349_RHYSE|nr:uncharacterized protein RCO7_02370 [Rhynchosporium commune]CZT43005.1 uncharacterized protein RSE6_02979 [Rhynchosporium secalis]
MLFKSLLSIVALLAVAEAAPSCPSPSNKHCKVDTLEAYDIANNTIIDIGADPLIPFSSRKLSGVNDTAWEFWFFDSTTDDGNAGISFAFWNDNSNVGLEHPPWGVLRLQTQVVFPNGTHWIETTWVDDNTLTTCKDSTTGVWEKPGYRYSFKTSNDLKFTTITLDSPTLKGTYTLTATAPPVYPDGKYWPNKRASASVMPWVYWNAAVPSGKVNVDIDVAGTQLKFTGIGGHDRNWAPFPLLQASLGFQESRVNAGPYTVLFWYIGSRVTKQTYLASVIIKSKKVVFTTKNFKVAEKEDYMLFAQSHVNDTSTPFDPTKARTTYDLNFVSADKKKNWKFAVDFADPEWALNDRGFSGIIPASVNGGEVGREQYKGAGTAMHAEFDPSWV